MAQETFQELDEIVVENGDFEDGNSEEEFSFDDSNGEDFSEEVKLEENFAIDEGNGEDTVRANIETQNGLTLPAHRYPGRGFETPFGYPGYFDGQISAKVYEYGGYRPTNIIRTDQSWGVHVKWKTSGKLTKMICGTWCVRIHMESIGRGPEFSLPAKAKKILLRPCDARGRYQTIHYGCKIHVPPGLIPAKYCSTPYKLVTTLTYLEPCRYKKRQSPGPIAAYVDGQILQFFHP